MQRITIYNPNGAYVAIDHTGGYMYRENGTETAYETEEGSSILHSGKYYLINADVFNPEIKAYTTEGYQQNGTTFQNIFLGKRTITIEAICCADVKGFYGNTVNFFYDMRKHLFDICNPLSGQLTITYERTGAMPKQIKAYCSKMPQETENLGTARKYKMEFTATSPFWEDTEDTTVNIEKASGGLAMGNSFWMFTGNGVQFGNVQDKQTINYQGTAPTGLTITCSTVTGCVNPMIVFTTDNISVSRYIQLNKTLSAGDKFIITTGYGDKNVTLNGENAMRYLTRSSEFVMLDRPLLYVSSSATSGTVSFTITYRNQYITL